MPGIEHNKQIVDKFYECLGSYDVAGLKEIVTEDLIMNVHNSGSVGGEITIEALPMLIQALQTVCPGGIRFELLDVTAEDNRLSVRANGYAKTVDGGEYNNRYHFLFKFRDGKIFETHEYMDSLLVENVLGPTLNELLN
ncbi:MAG: nuclear transport factor 2 family protein [Halieaceae bacterium]|nr:nuclear transport factor 2 family protein [Halieaceae bacterium]